MCRFEKKQLIFLLVNADAEPEEMDIDDTATGAVTDGPVYIGDNCIPTPVSLLMAVFNCKYNTVAKIV